MKMRESFLTLAGVLKLRILCRAPQTFIDFGGPSRAVFWG